MIAKSHQRLIMNHLEHQGVYDVYWFRNQLHVINHYDLDTVNRVLSALDPRLVNSMEVIVDQSTETL